MNRAGKMRHRVELQQSSNPRDADGGFTESWGTIATLWARIEPIDGSEFERGQKQEAGVTHKITMRYNSSITNTKRFLYGTSVYNIRAVLVQDKISDTTVVHVTETPEVSGSSGTVIYPPNSNVVPSFESDLLDFLTVQSVTFNAPRLFYSDRFEIVCEQMDGTIQTFPTFRLGIVASPQKYKADALGTRLTAVGKRHPFSTLLVDEGELQLVAAISVAGALSTGTNYKGRIIVKGTMP